MANPGEWRKLQERAEKLQRQKDSEKLFGTKQQRKPPQNTSVEPENTTATQDKPQCKKKKEPAVQKTPETKGSVLNDQDPVVKVDEASMTTHYHVLGVSEKATPKELKKAYTKKALQCHPDKNPSNKEKAERCMKRIAAAYSTLSNEEEKRKYDESLQTQTT